MVRVAELALQARARAEEAAGRAERAVDRHHGLLGIHFPKAQAPLDVAGCPPTIWCNECTQPWPCRTLQYVYQFGEFVAADPPAAVE